MFRKTNKIVISPFVLLFIIIFLPVIGFLLGNRFSNQSNNLTKSNSSNTQTVNSQYENLEMRVNKSKSLGFEILSPKEGEVLCRGKYYSIRWDNPSNVKIVDLYVRQAGAPPSETYDLGTFPADYENGEFSWRVGFTKGILYKTSEGTKELLSRPGYQIQISTPEKDYIDFSGIFTVTDCNN